MRVVYEYSHLGGAEILAMRFPAINEEVYRVIGAVKANRIKVSKERTKMDKLLYSPIDMNEQFKKQFRGLGYKEVRDTYTIVIPEYPEEIRGAYKQIDFTKNKVNIEVQFGKYAFMFYDMAKFQYFYNQKVIDVGVEIVPNNFLHHNMSSGVSYGEQLIYDIERLSRNFPSVPIKVILIDVD